MINPILGFQIELLLAIISIIGLIYFFVMYISFTNRSISPVIGFAIAIVISIIGLIYFYNQIQLINPNGVICEYITTYTAPNTVIISGHSTTTITGNVTMSTTSVTYNGGQCP